MILVDSSVWIDFFNDADHPSVELLDQLLAHGEVRIVVPDLVLFEVLRGTAPGRGDEIQLTDALQALAQMPAEQGGQVFGLVFRGRRYDTGDKQSYLQATVRLASGREDLGPDFRAWLREFVASEEFPDD